MITRHVARAVGVTSASAAQWRVDLETGTHHLVADEPINMAGGDSGPTPFGLLICALAACTAMTLRGYAERKGWQLATIEVSVVYNVTDDARTSIVRTITVPSELTEEQRARLADVAERTPVTMAIRAGTSIATTVRAVENSDRAANLIASTVSSRWPALPYEEWHATCDTLHAHTQILGKLAAALAPPEPQLQHAALRLSARGWESLPLPAPDRSGALVVALDLHTHDAVAEHSDGRSRRIPLEPDRPVAEVARRLLDAVAELAGPVAIDFTPQETPWHTALDEDYEHSTYNPVQSADYFAAATQAALVLAALRAPYRGRSTPVNAWWGTFDLAVSIFSGRTVDPPSTDFIMRNSANAQQIEVGWWPGYTRYPHAAFFAFAFPAPERLDQAILPSGGRWDPEMHEYILDWDDVRVEPDPHRAAVAFGQSVIRHACIVCDWDPELAASAQGVPPPVA